MQQGCLQVNVENVPSNVNICVEGDPPDFKEQDTADCILRFDPPLDRDTAAQANVSVVYCGDRQQPKANIFCTRVLPLRRHGTLHVLLKNVLEYELFETHQLRLCADGIDSMYMSFENNYLGMDRDTHVRIELKVDMNLTFMPQHVPGTFLMWFPPDVNPQEYNLVIDPRLVPQRTPLWFKLRGFSGTKAYQYLGFYYTSGEPTFSNFARTAMRLGTVTEEYALMAYLCQYPDRRYEEMGWCPAPPQKYPEKWGASPDGLFIDPQMTWDRTRMAPRDDMDVTRGACEFKTSRRKTCMEPYFIPQLYMEMIALNVAWADLVRYRYDRTYDPKRKQYVYNDVAYVYRYYRVPHEEAEMVALWKYAIAHEDQDLGRILHTDQRFCDMRHRLEERARKMKPVQIIRMTPALVKQYEAYRLHRLRVREPSHHAEWDTLNARHGKLMRLRNAKDVHQVVHLLQEQADTCRSLASKIQEN